MRDLPTSPLISLDHSAPRVARKPSTRWQGLGAPGAVAIAERQAPGRGWCMSPRSAPIENSLSATPGKAAGGKSSAVGHPGGHHPAASVVFGALRINSPTASCGTG